MSFYDTSVIKKRKPFYADYHGFDNYKTGLRYIDINKSNHKWIKELKIFSKWYKEDNRIFCDDTLIKTIDKIKG